jgi:serpin B
MRTQDARATAVARFAVELHGQLAREPGNVLWSPVNVAVALAMAAAGARGETAAQFRQVLRWGPAGDAPDVAGLLLRHAQAESFQVAAAAAVWPSLRARLVPAYRELVRVGFAASVTPLDFGRPEAAASAINAWAAEATRGMIPSVIAPRSITSELRLILSTAIWFRGGWRQPFDRADTTPGEFRTPAGRVTVPMMRLVAERRYTRTASAHVVQVDYRGGEVAMFLVVPKDDASLAAAEAELARRGIAAVAAGLGEREVDLALPRFRLSYHQDLVPALGALGLRAACDPGLADFSGMLVPHGPRDAIGMIEHSAVVEVDEEGTTAAAVTIEAMFGLSDEPEPPVVVRADHPFLFFIRDVHGTVLFMGRVEDPTAA